MAASVPIVEIADDADTPRVRCPDREGDAGDTADRTRVRSERIPEPKVRSLGDEVDVHVAENRPEAVRVLDLLAAVRGFDDERIIEGRSIRQMGFEEAVAADALELEAFRSAALAEEDAGRLGHRGAHDDAAVRGVHPEIRERVGPEVPKHSPGYGTSASISSGSSIGLKSA